MARNKKKSTAQQQRKRQQKQQRRSARKERQGVSRSFAAPTAGSPKLSPFPELAAYLNTNTGHSDIDAVIEIATDSGALVDEEEFDEIFLDPMEAVGTLIQTAEEMGYGPDILTPVETDEQADTRDELFSRLCRQLLTPTLRRQLIDGLAQLRNRLRAPDEEEMRMEAAAVQFFLEADRTDTVLPHLGFFRSFLSRSLEAGFTLMGSSMEIEEMAEAGQSISSDTLMERFTNSEWGAEVEKRLESSPGFRKYMDKQVDQIYDDGLRATFTGELPLNLFTPEEMTPAVELVRNAFDMEEARKGKKRDNSHVMKALIPQLLDYLKPLVTPTRVQQIEATLAERVAEASQIHSTRLPFLDLKRSAFAEADAAEIEQGFLVAALIGQALQILSSELDEDEQAA